MIGRRKFIQRGITASLASAIPVSVFGGVNAAPVQAKKPVVISTWKHGVPANEAAWKVLQSGGRALDAVETGVRVSEGDPEVMSVGFGGRPDRDGHVTLDACIMDDKGNAGAVCFLEHIKHPISVARLVMEKTPHVMLAGEGALKFALQNGFKKEDLLTEEAKRQWEEWKVKADYHPEVNVENHDTISMLALDQHGNLSGACTTSGLAYKMHGRVGDSPIPGAGMYCDNEAGAAAATGHGEWVMRTLGSFLVVELMRSGYSPQKACEEAIMRIVKLKPDFSQVQIGYIALNKAGETGAYCLQPGFSYALFRDGKNELISAEAYQNG